MINNAFFQWVELLCSFSEDLGYFLFIHKFLAHNY